MRLQPNRNREGQVLFQQHLTMPHQLVSSTHAARLFLIQKYVPRHSSIPHTVKVHGEPKALAVTTTGSSQTVFLSPPCPQGFLAPSPNTLHLNHGRTPQASRTHSTQLSLSRLTFSLLSIFSCSLLFRSLLGSSQKQRRPST
jgi:hypothetical protein